MANATIISETRDLFRQRMDAVLVSLYGEQKFHALMQQARANYNARQFHPDGSPKIPNNPRILFDTKTLPYKLKNAIIIAQAAERTLRSVERMQFMQAASTQKLAEQQLKSLPSDKVYTRIYDPRNRDPRAVQRAQMMQHMASCCETLFLHMRRDGMEIFHDNDIDVLVDGFAHASDSQPKFLQGLTLGVKQNFKTAAALMRDAGFDEMADSLEDISKSFVFDQVVPRNYQLSGLVRSISNALNYNKKAKKIVQIFNGRNAESLPLAQWQGLFKKAAGILPQSAKTLKTRRSHSYHNYNL